MIVLDQQAVLAGGASVVVGASAVLVPAGCRWIRPQVDQVPWPGCSSTPISNGVGRGSRRSWRAVRSGVVDAPARSRSWFLLLLLLLLPLPSLPGSPCRRLGRSWHSARGTREKRIPMKFVINNGATTSRAARLRHFRHGGPLGAVEVVPEQPQSSASASGQTPRRSMGTRPRSARLFSAPASSVATSSSPPRGGRTVPPRRRSPPRWRKPGQARTGLVDLFLLHNAGPSVPLAEQGGTLNAVRKAGKVRTIGVSNYNTALMDEAVSPQLMRRW